MGSVTVTKSQKVEAVGTPPKTIEEFFGRVATGDADVSIAVMRSPAGWSEPGQTPEFTERTAVMKGRLVVHLRDETVTVGAGQSITVPGGTWVQYETPEDTEYLAVCIPAFSPDTVHRDE
jgi:mannose-6-phosphate isomerase-like protein (cupin superfamily)